MSTGLVICSVCLREVHQDGDRAIRNGWRHCGRRDARGVSVICDGGIAVFPGPADRVNGPACEMDGTLPLAQRLEKSSL